MYTSRVTDKWLTLDIAVRTYALFWEADLSVEVVRCWRPCRNLLALTCRWLGMTGPCLKETCYTSWHGESPIPAGVSYIYIHTVSWCWWLLGKCGVSSIYSEGNWVCDDIRWVNIYLFMYLYIYTVCFILDKYVCIYWCYNIYTYIYLKFCNTKKNIINVDLFFLKVRP